MNMRRRNVYSLGFASPHSSTLLIQISKHDRSSNSKIRVIQIAFVHRAIAQPTSRILALQDEIDQSLLIEWNVVYSLRTNRFYTQNDHRRQTPPAIAQIALFLGTAV